MKLTLCSLQIKDALKFGLFHFLLLFFFLQLGNSCLSGKGKAEIN